MAEQQPTVSNNNCEKLEKRNNAEELRNCRSLMRVILAAWPAVILTRKKRGKTLLRKITLSTTPRKYKSPVISKALHN
jgi:hypothetical protein